jgi:hypothetical protein
MGIRHQFCPLLTFVLISVSSLFGAGTVLQVGGEKQLFVGPWEEDGRDAHLVESGCRVRGRLPEAELRSAMLRRIG